MEQAAPRNFIDVHVHHYFRAILVEALQDFTDQLYVFSRVSDAQTVRRVVYHDNALRPPYRRRQRRDDNFLGIGRFHVGQIKSPDHHLLELLPAGLVGNQNRPPIQFLKEQSLLQKNQVQRFRRGHVAQVDIQGRIPLARGERVSQPPGSRRWQLVKHHADTDPLPRPAHDDVWETRVREQGRQRRLVEEKFVRGVAQQPPPAAHHASARRPPVAGRDREYAAGPKHRARIRQRLVP